MPNVTFTLKDAEILYTIPKPPSDILEIVRSFMFTNRTAAPSYLELQDCLSKAFSAGIVHKLGGKLVVSDKWYQDIHAADKTADNEIDSMIEFTGWFIKREYPAICDTDYSIPKSEYELMLEGVAQTQRLMESITKRAIQATRSRKSDGRNL